jgi:predicted dehydrogenase
MPRQVIRIGMIGIGAHSSENLLPALIGLNNIELRSVSSRSIQKANIFAQKYGVKHKTENWMDLLNKDLVDGVMVSATPQFHSEVIRSALKVGIHVFTEKPPSPDLEDMRELVEIANEYNNVVSFVDYNFRFGVGYQKLLETMTEHGRIECVKIRFLTAKPRQPIWGMVSVFRSYLYAVGIHAIEMVVSLFGNVADISAKALRIREQKIAINVVISFEDGRIAFLDLGNYSNRFESRYEMITSLGFVGVLSDLKILRFYGDESSRVLFSSKEVSEYVISNLQGGYSVGGYEGAMANFRDSIMHNHTSASKLQGSEVVYWIIEEILHQIEKDDRR